MRKLRYFLEWLSNKFRSFRVTGISLSIGKITPIVPQTPMTIWSLSLLKTLMTRWPPETVAIFGARCKQNFMAQIAAVKLSSATLMALTSFHTVLFIKLKRNQLRCPLWMMDNQSPLSHRLICKGF